MALDEDLDLTGRADGGWDCAISRRWWVVDGPNGGYIGALLSHAGDRHLEEPARQLRTVTIHYLRRPTEGPATVRASTLHQGRSVSFVRIDLHQADRLVATATGAWGLDRQGIELVDWPVPTVPPPEQCVPMDTVRPGEPLPIHERWDIRSVGGVRFGEGGPAERLWWIRPPDHRPLDGAMLVAMADALPPPIFAQVMPTGGVPTIDLTVHVRADLAAVTWERGDWVLARFHSRLATAGFIEEDGELWTADGTLLANARQLAIAT